MEIKSGRLRVYNRKSTTGIPISFRIHWDKEIHQYILRRGFFVNQNYSIEEVEDMLKTLKEWNKKS